MIAIRRIEELRRELKTRYTIAIVTNNLRQAKRVAGRTGYMLECGPTQRLFESPTEEYTGEYVSGQFG